MFQELSWLPITLPLANPPLGTVPARHVEVQLDLRQGLMLQRLLYGMRLAESDLMNGRIVYSRADVVRRVLEIAAEAESPAE